MKQLTYGGKPIDWACFLGWCIAIAVIIAGWFVAYKLAEFVWFIMTY